MHPSGRAYPVSSLTERPAPLIDPEDLDRRITALERTVETERLARASMDIDLSELELAVRHNTNSIERLRTDLTGQLSEVRRELTEVRRDQTQGFRLILEELARINGRASE